MSGSVERTECQLCLMIASGWCQSRQRRGIFQQCSCSGASGCEQICTMCGEKRSSGRLPSRPLSGLVDLDYLHWQNDLLEKIVEWGFQTMPLPPPLLGSVGGNFWESRISRSMLQKHLRTEETELGNEWYQQKGKREKDMEAGERGAAGNHSLGGKRIKVAVGEGWHGYLYLHFRSTAVILQSVCETFLHSWQRGGRPKHSGSISHDDDVITRSLVDQLFIAEVGDVAVEWVAECLISSSALQTGKPPVCISNLLVCEHSTLPDYAEKTHFTYSSNTTTAWQWTPGMSDTLYLSTYTCNWRICNVTKGNNTAGRSGWTFPPWILTSGSSSRCCRRSELILF